MKPLSEYKPFLSVLIPVLNEEGYIGECLDSLQKQDYPSQRYEVIVIDGGSTDRTWDIAKQKGSEFENFHLLSNPKKIQAAALNIGLNACKGRFIVRLDGHTLADSAYLSKACETILTTCADHVGGIFMSTGIGFWGQVIARAVSTPIGVGNSQHRCNATSGWDDVGALGIYRVETLKKVGGFDEAFSSCEDCELDYRIKKNGGRVYRNGNIRFTYFARNSLKSLAKQYYRYGRLKVLLMRKLKQVPKLRHVIPLGFLLFLGLLIVGGMWLQSLWLVLAIVLVIYFSAVLGASFIELKQLKVSSLAAMMLSIATLHFSYGTGSFMGIIDSLLRPKMS